MEKRKFESNEIQREERKMILAAGDKRQLNYQLKKVSYLEMLKHFKIRNSHVRFWNSL